MADFSRDARVTQEVFQDKTNRPVSEAVYLKSEFVLPTIGSSGRLPLITMVP
jgi:hypothetical protein